MKTKHIKGLWMVVCAAMTALMVACGDDDTNEYAIDTTRLSQAMPGRWQIDEVERRETVSRAPVDEQIEALLNSTYDFTETQFTLKGADGTVSDRGTYRVGRFYVALTGLNGREDTLQIADVDRSAYHQLKLRKTLDNTQIVMTLNKQ